MKEKVATAIAVQAKVPVYLCGGGGEGKTAFVVELAKKLNCELKIFILRRHEPSDFLLPVREQNYFFHAIEKSLQEIYSDTNNTYILFLDEINNAPPPTAEAWLTFVQSGEFGGRIFTNVRFILAGNPPELGGEYPLISTMVNRVLKIEWKLPLDLWVRGMTQGDWGDAQIPIISPNDIKAHEKESRGLVVAFVQTHPHLLREQPKHQEAWASPRAWSNLASLLAAWKAAGAPENVLPVLVNGTVGAGAGESFLTWFNGLKIPPVDEILRRPNIVNKFPADWKIVTVFRLADYVGENYERLREIKPILKHLTDDFVLLFLRTYAQNDIKRGTAVSDYLRDVLEKIAGALT